MCIYNFPMAGASKLNGREKKKKKKKLQHNKQIILVSGMVVETLTCYSDSNPERHFENPPHTLEFWWWRRKIHKI